MQFLSTLCTKEETQTKFMFIHNSSITFTYDWTLGVLRQGCKLAPFDREKINLIKDDLATTHAPEVSYI